MLNIEMLSCKSTTNNSSLPVFLLVTVNWKRNVFAAKLRGKKCINMVSGAINWTRTKKTQKSNRNYKRTKRNALRSVVEQKFCCWYWWCWWCCVCFSPACIMAIHCVNIGDWHKTGSLRMPSSWKDFPFRSLYQSGFLFF